MAAIVLFLAILQSFLPNFMKEKTVNRLKEGESIDLIEVFRSPFKEAAHI